MACSSYMKYRGLNGWDQCTVIHHHANPPRILNIYGGVSDVNKIGYFSLYANETHFYIKDNFLLCLPDDFWSFLM